MFTLTLSILSAMKRAEKDSGLADFHQFPFLVSNKDKDTETLKIESIHLISSPPLFFKAYKVYISE